MAFVEIVKCELPDTWWGRGVNGGKMYNHVLCRSCCLGIFLHVALEFIFKS